MPIPHLRPVRRSRRQSSSPRRPEPRPRFFSRRRFKRLLPYAIGAVFLFGIALVAAFALIARDLPDPNQITDRAVAQSTRIYARDGKTLLYEIHGSERRTVIELKDIPDFAKNATISIEDKDFYQHGGFKFTSIVRAVLTNVLRGGKAQGGSTITQQLIKNTILSGEKTYTRKIKELVLAYEMERKFSKDQILKLYFNQIPYGSNAYGIEAAAETYFGKPARLLTLPEAALLAALPKAPTYYSPYGNHRDALATRTKHVLDGMTDQGYITKDEGEQAKAIDVIATIKPRRENILAPHFVFYIKELLSERYSETQIERGGLKVITTLDPEKQKIAEEEVAKGAEANEKKYRASNAALVSIDVKSGEIVAMVGSRDYFDETHDGNVNVTLAERNPGSSFKPIIYTSAFSRGFTPETTLFDLVTNFGPDGSGKPYIPQDYDGKERGPVSMRQALAGSLNIPAVETLYLAGIPRTVELANALGYTTLKTPEDYGLALALGGAGVKLLEHTAAFGVLARDGLRVPTTAILKVEDAKGKALEEYKKPKGEQVIDKNVVRLTNSILTDNNARAFIFGSRSPLILPKRTVAAKTGTTNDWRDGWTIGFTPSLVTGVWAANNDYSPMARGADGVFVAAPIWNAYMRRALADTPAEGFPKPKPNHAKNPILRGEPIGETTIKVDRITRKRIPTDCLSAWPAEFVDTTTVREYHSILFYVDLSQPDGDPPTNPAADPMYSRWEEAVSKWVKAKKLSSPTTPVESCTLRLPDQFPGVSFIEPTDNAGVTTAGVNASVTTSGPRTISQVEYRLDDSLVATATTTPFGALIPLGDATPGFHTLTAKVIDAVGNVGSASVKLNVTASTTPTVYFLEPAGPTSIAADAALTIKGLATDPAGVASVSVVEKTSDGLQELTRIDDPTLTAVNFSLAGLSPGSHSVALQLVGRGGQTTVTDFLIITVGS